MTSSCFHPIKVKPEDDEYQNTLSNTDVRPTEVDKSSLFRETTLDTIESEQTSVLDFTDYMRSSRKEKDFGSEIALSLDRMKQENIQRSSNLSSDDTTSSISDTESFSTLPDNDSHDYQSCTDMGEIEQSSHVNDMISTLEKKNDPRQVSFVQGQDTKLSFEDNNSFNDMSENTTVTSSFPNDSLFRTNFFEKCEGKNESDSFNAETIPTIPYGRNVNFRRGNASSSKPNAKLIPDLNKNIRENDLLRTLNMKKNKVHKNEPNRTISEDGNNPPPPTNENKYLQTHNREGNLNMKTDMDVEISEDDDQTMDTMSCRKLKPSTSGILTSPTKVNPSLEVIGEPQIRFTSLETCIILDWDDTLFPSSYVERELLNGISSFEELPNDRKNQFMELERQIMILLNKASEYGHVLIITNAQNGWVEFCCRRFLPNLMYFIEYGPRYQDYLELAAKKGKIAAKYTSLKDSFLGGGPSIPNRIYQDKFSQTFTCSNEGPTLNPNYEIPNFIKIVSARANFEAIFPRDTICWKAAAFAHELHYIQRINNVVLKNILSFGDSLDEQTAVKINALQLGSKSKSVKFLDNPSYSQLFRQLEVMVEYIPWISDNPQDLVILLTVQNDTPNLDREGQAPVVTTANNFNNRRSFSDDQMTILDD